MGGLNSEHMSQLDRDALDCKDIILTLPRVGQQLYRRPTICLYSKEKPVTQVCKVTYVNREHLWYEVEFEAKNGTRYKESYKMPFSLDPSRGPMSGGLFV